MGADEGDVDGSLGSKRSAYGNTAVPKSHGAHCAPWKSGGGPGTGNGGPRATMVDDLVVPLVRGAALEAV
jgi:hypothetical protein